MLPPPTLPCLPNQWERASEGSIFHILEKLSCSCISPLLINRLLSPPRSDGDDRTFLWSQLDWNDLMKFFKYFSPGRLFWNKKWLEFHQTPSSIAASESFIVRKHFSSTLISSSSLQSCCSDLQTPSTSHRNSLGKRNAYLREFSFNFLFFILKSQKNVT